MNSILKLLGAHGVSMTFANVFLEQLGMPIPAYPVLIVTGALSAEGRYSLPVLLGVSVFACLLADSVWFFAGRRFGGGIVRRVCRVSLSPDSCVRQTESLYERWGVYSLLIAKFVPGLGAISTALAGNLRVPVRTFLLFDAIGAALYAGLGLALGRLFSKAVGDILNTLDDWGRLGFVALLAALALFIAWKLWQRFHLLRELRMTRISVPELLLLAEGKPAPAIVDVRTEGARERDGAIPGSLHWQLGTPKLPDLPRDAEIIIYCACPNEISAARVAREWRRAGFTRIRPLYGGIDAWIAAGQPLERRDTIESPGVTAQG